MASLRARTGSLLAALLSVSAAGAAGAAAGPGAHPVRILVFLSKNCPGCDVIGNTTVEGLARTLGCEVRTRYLSSDAPEEYAALVRLEQAFGDEGNEPPIVFIGRHVLSGRPELERSLAAVVRRYASEGGAEQLPEPPPKPAGRPAARAGAPRRIHLAYFDSPGCKGCRRVEHMIEDIARGFPTVTVRKFVTADRGSQLVQEAIGHRAGLPAAKRLLTPAIVVGREAFVEKEITDRRLHECLTRLEPLGTECPWEDALDLDAAAERLFGQAGAVRLGAVVAGGLLDGINPCAFATLILFVSYVRSAQRDRRRLLAVGLAFIAGVFLSYMAIGLGLSELARAADSVPLLGAAVTWGIVALCVALSLLSARDAWIAARGQHAAIWLQLPRGLKDRIQLVVLRFRSARWLILGGLVMGWLVSVLELVCTGQIYLPLVKYMVSSGAGGRARAVGLLAVYNLCFVMPLLAILAGAYFGASSQRLAAILRRHMAATKAATAVFFAALAALMALY